MSLSLTVKAGLGLIASACNVLDTISRNPPKSIILGYHRVLPADSSQLSFCAPGMYVTPDTLRRHLVFLKQHYKLVNLTELLENNAPDKCCAITFDDGWRDNYVYAYPILKEMVVPATIFLTTGFIESQQWPWPERLTFYGNSVGYKKVVAEIGKILAGSGCLKPDKAVSSITCCISHIKMLSHNNILKIMDSIDSRYSDLYEKLHQVEPALTWNMVKEMKIAKLYFGLHSHSHIISNKATPASLLEEDYMTACTLFCSELGEQPRIFAYPNGNYNNDAIQILRKLSIDVSVTTQPGALKLSEPMTLNRILLHEDVSSTEKLLAYKLISSVWNP